MINRTRFLARLSALAAVAALPTHALAETAQVTHSDAEWRRLLGPQRYYILREGGTEPPYSSPLNNERRSGKYHCAGCDLALFSSRTKYDAGEGWPSFWNVLPNATRTRSDHELIEERTEVHCRRCGGHLGHIFPDGPPPTNQRYCIDGLALNFVPGLP